MAGKAGRPKGSRNVLPYGTQKLIKAARQADELGIKTDEAWGVILGIMRGEINERHLRERLSAAVFVLEQEIGKARQRIEVRDDRDGVYRSEFADGTAVRTSSDPSELPN